LSRKSDLSKLKKPLGLRGSRFNANCVCGCSLRLKMDPAIAPRIYGQRMASGDKTSQKTTQVEIGVNPSRCPDCGLFAVKITIMPDNRWWVVTNNISEQGLDDHRFNRQKMLHRRRM